MASSMDAVADVALAEGVYQVTQGNHDRGAAMLQAISRGTHPPEPEILRTPRSGAVVNQRVVLHVDPASLAPAWTSAGTPRSQAEPG